MSSQDKIKAFLKERDAISISSIEKESGLPATLLSKFLKGNRPLNTSHLKKIIPILEKYGYEGVQDGCKIIAVVNHKGGVSKTTSTQNIGACLANFGYSVLLVDLDSQANLTENCGIEAEGNLFDKSGSTPVNIRENLDIIPCDLFLHDKENELRQDLDQWYKVKKRLDPLRVNYDFILIDTAPNLLYFTTNAMVAADEILIPTQAQKNSAGGIGRIMEYLDQINEQLTQNKRIMGIAITQYSALQKAQEIVEENIQDSLGDLVFDQVIPLNSAVQQANLLNQDIFEYQPKSKAAQAYQKLTKEILRRY
ncbi:MAG: ParA family protein [Cytophagales bacterium]|nr:ParA family protein [Cytophagales bacterium]